MNRNKELISMKFYEIIKKYRNPPLGDSGCYTLRGILDRKETWLLEELEKAVGEVYEGK